MTHILDNLIQRCIARNKQPLQAHKTQLTRDRYSIYYASRDGKPQSAVPRDFEKARLSIFPIGSNGSPIEQYAAPAGKDWQTRYGFNDWQQTSWKQSYGIQVYTGTPSDNLTDLDFEFAIVQDHPAILLETLSALLELTPNPCLTLSKSGGLRYSCRTPSHVHPRNTENREYIAKWNQETGTREALYLEIFGDKGLSRWDARYQILTGDLFDLPVISDIDALFEIIDNLKSKIHVPAPPKQEKKQKNNKKPPPSDDVKIVDDLPSDLEWISTGEADEYKSRRSNYPCQVTKHTKSHGAAQYYKDTQTDGISGFCHNCREFWEVVKPKRNRTAPDRLHITGTPPETTVYEKTQAAMKKQILAWEQKTRDTDTQHLLNIITPAQTGKTTVTIATAEKLTYVTQTQKKAVEAYDEAIRNGKNSYLHKSRMWNRKDSNWGTLPFGTDIECRPCIHPEICNSIASKGFSPVKEFCRVRCEKYNICKVDGYLSQLQNERLTDHVYFWQGEAFFADEIYRSRVQNVIGDKDCILAIDEPNPADLTQKRIINLDALLQTFNNIRYSPDWSDIAQFLKELIEGLATQQSSEDIRNSLQTATMTLSKADAMRIDKELLGIPVSFVWQQHPTGKLFAEVIYNDKSRMCEVVDDNDDTPGTIPERITRDGIIPNQLETRSIDLSLFERLGFIDLRKEAEQAPRVYHNLVADIRRFIESDSHVCHRTDGNAIVFYLPPSIIARRGITMNASDADNLIGEVYHDTGINVETITGNPPPWKQGCLLYQISTGRYSLGLSKANPQRSLFIVENNKPISVKSTLRDFLNIILNTAEKYSVLVIGAKRLQDTTIDPLLAQINAHENITLDTHIGAQGKNEYRNRDVVFVFCFEPQPDVIKAEAKRIYRHAQDLSFDRKTTDETVDGITLKDVMRYTDPRVRKIYNLHCEKAHMQAILRLRQALNENKTAILFSAEPVSQMPVTPIKFRKKQLLDFQKKDDWQLSELQGYFAAEENRQTKPTQKELKAEKKARAKTLDEQNVPVAKICAELNIKSRKTFYNWKNKDFE
ncbi:MAG: hypothetical protein OXM61_07150 [Candidatus Poribacteria bacterium]|nr:hypothetical protein [Candidatus Poribacteria bacterium]